MCDIVFDSDQEQERTQWAVWAVFARRRVAPDGSLRIVRHILERDLLFIGGQSFDAKVAEDHSPFARF